MLSTLDTSSGGVSTPIYNHHSLDTITKLLYKVVWTTRKGDLMNTTYKQMLAQLEVRNKAIRELRASGELTDDGDVKWTYVALGRKYKLTGQRIQAICDKG